MLFGSVDVVCCFDVVWKLFVVLKCCLLFGDVGCCLVKSVVVAQAMNEYCMSSNKGHYSNGNLVASCIRTAQYLSDYIGCSRVVPCLWHLCEYGRSRRARDLHLKDSKMAASVVSRRPDGSLDICLARA